ncbi:MAG TPA: DNA (cytosine-5-)-methyltransferase [Gemmatimonadaceae bacterium]|nr:DNA (cytosine-5-)-methyltransferase [Gemmatimonadaceae bacterium]
MTPTEQNPALRTVHHALRFWTQAELAERAGVQPRTVRRWVAGESVPKWGIIKGIEDELARDERPRQPDFTFIDLFAGVGGLRRPFEELNGRCVFTSEWDAHAARTYTANFPDGHDIWGDITKKSPSEVPDHDLLLAGFPCQPFSLAGVSKKNSLGRAHGFLDKTQGTLFFNIVEILRAKKPKAFLLENVKNLQSHDGGRTFTVITGALRELGYTVETRVLSAAPWVPQRRERVFLVGFKRSMKVRFDFESVKVPKQHPKLGDILHTADEEAEAPYTSVVRGKTVVDARYTLSDHLWQYLQAYAAKHRDKGNGFGCSVFGPDDVARTLSARYHKDGSEILIAQPGKNPRRLTPRECARLMGFEGREGQRMKIPVSDTQAYRQFGNSVAVPVVRAIAKELVPRLLRPELFPLKQQEMELAAG